MFSRFQPKLLLSPEPQNQRNLLVQQSLHHSLLVEAEILRMAGKLEKMKNKSCHMTSLFVRK